MLLLYQPLAALTGLTSQSSLQTGNIKRGPRLTHVAVQYHDVAECNAELLLQKKKPNPICSTAETYGIGFFFLLGPRFCMFKLSEASAVEIGTVSAKKKTSNLRTCIMFTECYLK